MGSGLRPPAAAEKRQEKHEGGNGAVIGISRESEDDRAEDVSAIVRRHWRRPHSCRLRAGQQHGLAGAIDIRVGRPRFDGARDIRASFQFVTTVQSCRFRGLRQPILYRRLLKRQFANKRRNKHDGDRHAESWLLQPAAQL